MTASTGAIVWERRTNVGATVTTATQNPGLSVWIEWCEEGTSPARTPQFHRVGAVAVNVPPPPPPETSEQAAERICIAAALAASVERKYGERELARRAAEKLANELLRQHLTKRQRREYRRRRYFHVTAPSGRRFRIERRRPGNVVEIRQGKPVNRFCIHPYEDVPDPDTMLAQKLLLEANEDAFYRIANRMALPAGAG